MQTFRFIVQQLCGFVASLIAVAGVFVFLIVASDALRGSYETIASDILIGIAFLSTGGLMYLVSRFLENGTSCTPHGRR